MSEHNTCQQPDRDVSGIVCGHPLPCPYHTFTIEGGKVYSPEDRVATRLQHKRLKDIATTTEETQ